MDILNRILPGVGERVSRYELVQELGRGGFGAVFRARQAGLDADVAVKFMIPQPGEDGMQFTARFEREAAIMKRLEHPATLKVRDFGRTGDGIPYLVTEFVRGRTLTAVVRESPLSADRVIRIGKQVLGALAEAHHQQIIHRDLKPDNIMLRDIVGERDAVKVLDFGISKVVGDAGIRTRTGTAFGTPWYMSPEQARGQKGVDARLDLYALGLILAECLTGRRVVAEEDTMSAVFAQARPEPLLFEPYITQSPLWPVIERATQKDADRRYPNALAMRDALEQIERAVWTGSGAVAPQPQATPHPPAQAYSPTPPPATPSGASVAPAHSSYSQPTAPASTSSGASAASAAHSGHSWVSGPSATPPAPAGGPVMTPPPQPVGHNYGPAQTPGYESPSVVGAPGVVGPSGVGGAAQPSWTGGQPPAAATEPNPKAGGSRRLLLPMALVTVLVAGGVAIVALLAGNDAADRNDEAISASVARVDVSSNVEGASVAVDRETLAETSADGSAALELPPGTATVTITKAGYLPQSATLELTAGSSTALEVALLGVNDVARGRVLGVEDRGRSSLLELSGCDAVPGGLWPGDSVRLGRTEHIARLTAIDDGVCQAEVSGSADQIAGVTEVVFGERPGLRLLVMIPDVDLFNGTADDPNRPDAAGVRSGLQQALESLPSRPEIGIEVGLYNDEVRWLPTYDATQVASLSSELTRASSVAPPGTRLEDPFRALSRAYRARLRMQARPADDRRPHALVFVTSALTEDDAETFQAEAERLRGVLSSDDVPDLTLVTIVYVPGTPQEYLLDVQNEPVRFATGITPPERGRYAVAGNASDFRRELGDAVDEIGRLSDFRPLTYGELQARAEQQALSDRLIGVWETSAFVPISSSNEEANQMADLLRQSELVIEYNADGTLTRTMTLGGRSQRGSGSWQATRSGPERLTVTMTEGDSGASDTIVHVFTDDDTFTFDRAGVRITMTRRPLINGAVEARPEQPAVCRQAYDYYVACLEQYCRDPEARERICEQIAELPEPPQEPCTGRLRSQSAALLELSCAELIPAPGE